MSRIDIQEIRFFKQQLKSSNEEMRAVLENIQLHALAYADDTSMSGQAVKTSQAYFQATYTTVTESLLEILDTSEALLKKYLNDFSNQVDSSPSCRIDSDLLQMAADKVGQIKRKQEDLQQSLSSATAGLYEGKAQQLRMDLAEAVEQEKILERYQEFENSHNGFFQELCELMYKTRQALQHVLTNVTFNEQQGSYSFPVGYADTLSALQKELNEVRGIDPKKEKELEAYEIYAVVYIGANGKPEVMWILEQNGHAVRNYELTGYLDRAGKYLQPEMYQILSLDDIEDKVLEGWKEGGYYLSGKKYEGALGGTVKVSAYVQNGANWVQDSGIYDAINLLGLSYASFKTTNVSAFGKMSAEDAARYSKFWDDVYKGKTVNQRMGVEDIQLNRVGKQEYEFSSYDPDPAKAVHGPGKESHPKEWNETINNLEKDGVEIISKDSNGSIAYAPKSDFRNPQMIISDDVSYSALMHEQQHYLDDMENGFPGPAFSYQTLNRWKSEFNAYMREIKIAEKAGNNKLAGQLYENYIRERRQLLGY